MLEGSINEKRYDFYNCTLHNEEESLKLFYKDFNKCIKKIKNINYELILVNDGSKDKTLDVILELAKKDNNIKYFEVSAFTGKGVTETFEEMAKDLLKKYHDKKESLKNKEKQLSQNKERKKCCN